MIRIYSDDVLIVEEPEEEDFDDNGRCLGCGAPLVYGEPFCEYCGRKRKMKEINSCDKCY